MYANDLAMIAEDGEGIGQILRALERWSDRNEMKVNVEKTKSMVFKKGRRKKKEKWEYKGEEVEVVNEFKYLGYWFTTKNQYNTHVRKVTEKAQHLIGKTWSKCKRAGIKDLYKKLFYMDSIVL